MKHLIHKYLCAQKNISNYKNIIYDNIFLRAINKMLLKNATINSAMDRDDRGNGYIIELIKYEIIFLDIQSIICYEVCNYYPTNNAIK